MKGLRLRTRLQHKTHCDVQNGCSIFGARGNKMVVVLVKSEEVGVAAATVKSLLT